MLLPLVSAWVVERDSLAADRIKSRDIRLFVAIAAQAGKGEVDGTVASSSRSGHDVLHGKGIRRVSHRGETVFTASVGPFLHQPSLARCGCSFSHAVGCRSPTASLSPGKALSAASPAPPP